MGLLPFGGSGLFLELFAGGEWGGDIGGGGKDVVVGEGGGELGRRGGEAYDAGGEPGLGGDGDLGAAGGGGVEDAIGGIFAGGGEAGCGGAEGEPLELFSGLSGEEGLTAGAGAHETGADGGDADVFLAELGVEAFGEAGEGELAGDVGEEVRDGDFAADGGDVDDGGAAAAAFLLREHVWEGGLDGVEGGVEVGVHGAGEGFEGLVLEGADLDDAGVVDEDIDSTEVVAGLVDDVSGLGGVGEVGGNEEDVIGGGDGALIEQGLLGAGELAGVAGGEDEAVSGFTEAMGEREAEAAGAAGDDDDLPGEARRAGGGARRLRRRRCR